MSTYLKYMAGYKQSQLKNKSFAEIQKLFDKAMTRVNMFVDKDTELVKESSKKAEAKIAKERSSKEQLVTEEDVAIDAIPLATKPAPIVNFQIHRKGRKGYYEIMRADGSAKTYLLFSQLLKEFYIEDKENVWKLVKEKHVNTSMEEFTRKESTALEGRIVRIKRLHDDLRVTVAQLVLLVQSYNCLLRVNAVGTKLQLLKDYNCSRIKTAKKIKIDWRSRILT
ncbi:hypothetical protein Tco_1362957 [Tanacetum coccineum]